MARQAATRRAQRRTRGVVVRGCGIFVGTLLGCGVVAVTAAPLAWATPQLSIATSALRVTPAEAENFAWPATGSAAVAIPAVGIDVASSDQKPAPIASLTKLMTAYVVLQDLPLSIGQRGACLYVNSADVAAWQHDVTTDQSNVKVAVGERLCEIDLLNGLFVHSANNFAALLVRLVGDDENEFLHAMRVAAHNFAMTSTNYADVSGINPFDTSTAHDQMILVRALMSSPLVRAIVRQTSVSLPVAGVVHTYTPLLGTLGVVGVKSGRTGEAGGCDVMALNTTVANSTFVTYAIVLSQQGGDVLAAAGAAAYQLARSAARQVVGLSLAANDPLGTIRWSSAHASLIVESNYHALWWRSAPKVDLWLLPVSRTQCTLLELHHSHWIQPLELGPSFASGHVPERWSTTRFASSCVYGGMVIVDVQFGGAYGAPLDLVASHTLTLPTWWRGLL